MENGNEILSYNPYKPVKKIIGILHECNIPITAIDTVFELVKADIEANTIPYQPNHNECLTSEAAILDTIDTVTGEPNL